MNCHIVPMAYLRSWSTDETYSAERKKRKIYVSKKGKVPIKSQIIKTEKVRETTIAQEDLYLITEAVEKLLINPKKRGIVKINPKQIEESMSIHYEQPWGNAMKELKGSTPSTEQWEGFLQLFLEFVALQLVRNPQVVKGIIAEAIPLFKKNPLLRKQIEIMGEEEFIHNQFLCSLYQSMSGMPSMPLSELTQKIDDDYQRYLLYTKGSMYEFITSDFPICNNNSGRVDEGLYFPINRNACLFLAKGKNDDNLEVIEASSEVVQFVNHLIRKAAKKILISSVPLTEDYFLETCPKEEFRKILGVE